MNQTTAEYLDAEYGAAQEAIQLELDWVESVALFMPTCTECGEDLTDYGDFIQCAYCD